MPFYSINIMIAINDHINFLEQYEIGPDVHYKDLRQLTHKSCALSISWCIMLLIDPDKNLHKH